MHMYFILNRKKWKHCTNVTQLLLFPFLVLYIQTKISTFGLLIGMNTLKGKESMGCFICPFISLSWYLAQVLVNTKKCRWKVQRLGGVSDLAYSVTATDEMSTESPWPLMHGSSARLRVQVSYYNRFTLR